MLNDSAGDVAAELHYGVLLELEDQLAAVNPLAMDVGGTFELD